MPEYKIDRLGSKTLIDLATGKEKTPPVFNNARAAVQYCRQNPQAVEVRIWGASYQGLAYAEKLMYVQGADGTVRFYDLPFMASTIRFLDEDEELGEK